MTIVKCLCSGQFFCNYCCYSQLYLVHAYILAWLLECIEPFFTLISISQSIRYAALSYFLIQSTLVISNSKGLSELLRDIRSSTYQVCRIEEKIIRLTTFNKLIGNWTFEVRDILKILWKRGEIAPQEQFLLFSTIFSICC